MITLARTRRTRSETIIGGYGVNDSRRRILSVMTGSFVIRMTPGVEAAADVDCVVEVAILVRVDE